MKTHKGHSGVAPLTLNFGLKCRLLVNFTLGHFTPREGATVAFEQVTVWAVEHVWMLFER
jgi:hypothetical protein